MINHYLLTLTPDAEDDVLTGILAPGSYGTETQRCLVGWAADLSHDTGAEDCRFFRRRQFERNTSFNGYCVEERFDSLCERFGIQRIANAIRDRILANQARRVLSQSAVRVSV